MLRRLALTTAGSLAALTLTPATATALPLPPLLAPAEDSLTVTVSKTGYANADGTFELTCGTTPEGNHPAAKAACARLDELAQQNEDPFAPLPQDQMCTQMYGGPATAHVTGTWQGRTIEAHFSRTDGCEVDRWEKLQPVLPILSR
ncbi:SSI family serine proteinase inhibitor [Streptomyces purpureus]|uniref:Subtilisin inhibitor domain-containing protein n=1 Tax=Streptomyces purpureus TaxID=1951 RepID=A0A918GYM0_9ACTN|nr:SSI family serine proteinase inhibitor [Streptomyces purpureus]GGT21922.1 hypothetical protein GCM10014713_13680 [Streptomyces purpureus]